MPKPHSPPNRPPDLDPIPLLHLTSPLDHSTTPLPQQQPSLRQPPDHSSRNCARGSTTHVIIELLAKNAQPAGVLALLSASIQQEICSQYGDGLIPHGLYISQQLAPTQRRLFGFGPPIRNNYQLPRAGGGVMGAAVRALSECMLAEDNAGSATFTVFGWRE
ncbi:hypothetical protein MMC08_009163 [Hypocenomyce scalaris]|nr:hypothetical protein [Hypocenomyce scalaris]